jgi:hypothetical protein
MLWQVEVPGNKLKQELLLTKNVYILDSHSDLFVWVGKKSTRLVRAAALKLSSELFSMLIRPEYAMIHRVSEGTESQARFLKFIFKIVHYPVLRIHEILVRIRIRGSIALTNGSGSRSCFFVSDLQDVKKVFCLLLFEGTFTSFFKDKKSKRSHKTVGINVFLTIFA